MVALYLFYDEEIEKTGQHKQETSAVERHQEENEPEQPEYSSPIPIDEVIELHENH